MDDLALDKTQVLSSQPKLKSRFVLGTVQLGIPYGRANTHGLPDDIAAHRLLEQAVSMGITEFDTARAYGISEARLGKFLATRPGHTLDIITKLDPLKDLAIDSSCQEIWEAVDASIAASCKALQATCLPTLLLHRWEYYSQYQGLIWERLLMHQETGKIQKLGASVYNVQQAIEALSVPAITHLQLPCNLLDWRWKAEIFTQAVKRRPDVIIHVRSVLLQGLLTTRAAIWPQVDIVVQQKIQFLMDTLVRQFARTNWVDLSYAYMRSLPWITNLVIGLETIEQLEANVALLAKPPLTQPQSLKVQQTFAFVPESVFDPLQWRFQ